ncbi:MAG: hypothetical protein ACYC40_02805, partial [Patescibacteria group bacterium]
MKKKSALIIFVVILLWIFNQTFFFWPSFFYSSLAIGALLIILLTRSLVQPFRKHGWLIWIIAPILFWFSVSLYTTIIVGQLWIQVLFIVMACFLYSYFNNLYHYLPNKTPELNKKFDSVVLSGGVLICAASGSSLY